MTSKNLWMDNILMGIEPLSDPIQGFSCYIYDGLIKHYKNFLDYIGTWLYDNVDLEDFINKYARGFDLYQTTINELQELHLLLAPFYQECSELSDFEVIRRPEWDVMIPIAKKCVRLLEQEKKRGDPDMVLSDEYLDSLKNEDQ